MPRLPAMAIAVVALAAFAGCSSPAPPSSSTSVTFVPGVRLAAVVPDLTAPVAVAEPVPGRLYIAEQGGAIKVWDGHESTVFLDLSGKVTSGGEQGLLGLAFAPGGEERFVVDYTDRGGDTVIELHEGTVGSQAGPGTLTSRVLLRIPQPYANHNGGQVQFGPDGYLYIGTGDGGSAGDPQGHAQDTRSLLGKILRIDVGPNATQPYGIPPGNPFADGKGGAPEVLHWGLRNPWRFSFDAGGADGSGRGDLWIGDVGQDHWEEVDVARAKEGQAAGLNFGWNALEGSHAYRAATPAAGAVAPVHEYPHERGDLSITGGYVVRGPALPALAGYYVFGDFGSGRIWALKAAAPSSPPVLLESGAHVASFGLTYSGDLLVVDHAGTVSLLLPA